LKRETPEVRTFRIDQSRGAGQEIAEIPLLTR
jgi:hypothetical protein